MGYPMFGFDRYSGIGKNSIKKTKTAQRLLAVPVILESSLMFSFSPLYAIFPKLFRKIKFLQIQPMACFYLRGIS